jgi:gamma-glutamyltranspeptidase/glutathione hydrolase
MAASSHWLASASAMSVLERGGNAADAAAAAGFVLQVVTPQLHGPGGEVPILLWDTETEKVSVVNGQGQVPRRATIEHFESLGLDLIPGTGLLAATVPGAFGAWTLLVERYGTWRVGQVLEYAIHYAERGFPLVGEIVETVAKNEATLRNEWTSTGDVYLPGGRLPEANTQFRNPVLAATFRRIVAEAQARSTTREGQLAAARAVFYEGFVADAICRYVAATEAMDTSGRRHRGLLDGDDLAAFQPAVEEPVRFDYGGYAVHKTRPWGQGPVLLQELSLLAGFDLDGHDHLSADFVHLVVECTKLAFADREAWYGDPERTHVPVKELLSSEYADQRRRLVGREASYELRPGSPDEREPRLPAIVRQRWAAALPPGAPDPGPESPAGQPKYGDTCHVDVVDSRGMMISATPSGGWLQGSPVIPELGFSLGVRGQTFWLEPGHPNSLVPGGRPRTTLSPTLVTFDGAPHLAFGTSGGDQQDQWQLAFFLAQAHGKASMQEAIEQPRFHTAHFPNSFFPRKAKPGRVVVEDRIDPAVVDELRGRGHEVVLVRGWSEGPRLCAVRRDPVSGVLSGAADPRGSQAYAVGR